MVLKGSCSEHLEAIVLLIVKKCNHFWSLEVTSIRKEKTLVVISDAFFSSQKLKPVPGLVPLNLFIFFKLKQPLKKKKAPATGFYFS